MSIEVLDKRNPVILQKGSMDVEIYAFEHHQDRNFAVGEEVTDRQPFAYITQQTEYRACTYGASKQKVSIISGIVRSDPPQSFRKEVKERVFDGLLALPFHNTRHKFAMRRTKADILATKAIKNAINSRREETPLPNQELATG